MTEHPRVADLDLNLARCEGDRLAVADLRRWLAGPASIAEALGRALRSRSGRILIDAKESPA